ncbi:hypothetical protein ACSBR2_005768 [Camellia fascicularis]
MKRLQEAQVEAERSRVSCRVSSSCEEDTDMKTLEYVSLFSDRIELCFELHDNHAELSTSICASFLDVSATSSAVVEYYIC